jgi:hypothetical protein
MSKERWISSSIKHPGALREAAQRHGQSTMAFAQAHKSDGGTLGKRSRLALILRGLGRKGK